MKIRTELTAARLREVLHYDSDTGIFRWRMTRRGRGSRAGTIAGTTGGYCSIGIERGRYLTHRLAFLYVHGRWPAGFLDHKDGNPSNNRIDNLREATQTQNLWNKKSTGNSLGFRGVTARRGKTSISYRAGIKLNRRTKYVGTFSTPEEAHAAWARAAREAYGEFFREA